MSAFATAVQDETRGCSTVRRCLCYASHVNLRLRAIPWLGLAWVTIILAVRVGAEEQANWRLFRTSDGLRDSAVSAVTVSPRGNVWAKHSDVNEISVLDGYEFHAIPSPGRDNYRIYESQTGQLWSLYAGGIIVFEGGQWVRHPVAEIRAEVQADPLRQIRQIPLLPVQQGRVLFLLSDRLMEYDVVQRQLTLLKQARESGLGRFVEMNESRDRGLWITGLDGIGKLPRPVREITSTTPWQMIHFLRKDLGVENMQRPFESSEGSLILAGSDASGDNKRAILKFDGTRWMKYSIGLENIRQAWGGWDDTVWAYTINSLIRFTPGLSPSISKERIWWGQYKDVAVETNGVFWLATSEGLVRYAPYLWRRPRQLEGLEAPVHAMLEDSRDRLWFASAEGLVLWDEAGVSRHRLPEGFEGEFQATDALFELANGTLAIASKQTPLLFDPEKKSFSDPQHSDKARLQFVGEATNKQIWVQVADSGLEAGKARLELYDGNQFHGGIELPEGFTDELFFAHQSVDGGIWVGGSHGVAVYRDGKWNTFGHAEGFRADKAYCWLEHEGKIWCAGTDRIVEFDGTRWSLVRSGLDRVSAMVRSRTGKIWVATGNGLYAHANDAWVANGVEEGLPSASISEVMEDRRGRIWAGTAGGVSLYHPDSDRHPPKTLTPTMNIRERTGPDVPISIMFSAIDKWQYSAPERLLFSHRIDEGQWSPYTNALTAMLENLRAGKHRLEVRSMDRNWNESESFAFVDFSIVIPWYQEKRLIVVMASGLVLVLFFAGLAVNRHLQLIRSYAEVERIVAVRTRELERANQEILHSQKMRALGTLAAGIAHDFNNILSIIKGSAQIIENHPEDKEKIRTRVGRIKTVVDQGAGIVKSMLGLSRVTHENLQWVDVNLVVEETIKTVGDRFLHEVTIRFEPGRALPQVKGLRELIQQMLLNLVLNAADAMSGQGEITLRTGVVEESPSGMALAPAIAPRYVFIAVQDSGSGIAPEVLPRIFEPFFTTKSFSSRRGTGLGLSMVYELAKELGYGLRVDSVLGQGSTFTIYMPERFR